MATPQPTAALTEYQYDQCAQCGEPAVAIAKGCMDKEPVLLCQAHLTRGLEVIDNYVRLWRRLNKRVMVCGDCHRPILSLDTHLEIHRIELPD